MYGELQHSELHAVSDTSIKERVFCSQSLSTEAKNWRYWPNIGCYEFSFERTVFFELTGESSRLLTNDVSKLCE